MADETAQGARIFLVDDHPAIRQGLALLLCQEGFVICGEVESRTQTLEILSAATPDLVLVDISLGNESGLDLIRELRARDHAILVYSMHDDVNNIEQAFAAGAIGYVTKRELSETLLEGIREVLAGRRYVSGVAAQSLASGVLSSSKAFLEFALSERERQIMTMLGQGESNADIAAAFAIGIRTVETYYARIINKLNMDGMKALRRYAIKTR
jgi:two-component system, NarL family, invasion response regulator UvrY